MTPPEAAPRTAAGRDFVRTMRGWFMDPDGVFDEDAIAIWTGDIMQIEREAEAAGVGESADSRPLAGTALDRDLLIEAMQAHQDTNGRLPAHARYHCGGTCGYDIEWQYARLAEEGT